MKNLLFAVMMFMLASSLVAHAEALSPQQAAIQLFLKKMYAISFDEFESGTFGAKFKNGTEVVEGKYDPDRQCRLLAKFLVKEAVIENKKDSGCLTGVYGYFRYPSLDGMDLGSLAGSPPPRPPAAHINTPVVNGDNAKVHVTFPINGTNVMYYLRKTPVGWRIYRVESSENSATIDTMSQGDTVNVFPPEAPSK